MDVSIIIVNYNTKELLRNCLQSIYDKTKDISFEVIVSDNNSSDGSVEMIINDFKNVILIKNTENLGFGAANNRALSIAKGKYVFYLNSDTVLLNNAVKMFYDYWESSNDSIKIGALGANLLNKDKEIIHSYGQFDTFKSVCILYFKIHLSIIKRLIFHKQNYKKNIKNPFFEGDVDFITGADLFVLNNSFAYFDENYFLYSEDCDLQWQMKNANLIRRIIKGPQIIHLEGASTKELKDPLAPYKKGSRIMQGISRIRFIKKNQSKLLANLLKIKLTLIWLHPCLIKYTSRYFRKMWSV